MRIQDILRYASRFVEPTRVLIALLIAVLLWLMPLLAQPPLNNTEKVRKPLQEAGGIALVSAIQFRAQNCSRACQSQECVNWKPGPSPACPNPGQGGGCCLAYETVCDPGCEDPAPVYLPPTISAALNCTASGNNGWCIGDLSVNLTASDPQGQSLRITGTVGSQAFDCSAGVSSCSIAIDSEAGGTVTYHVASATGLSANGSIAYKLDYSDPYFNGSISAVPGTNGWYRSNATFNVTAGDAASGIASFTAAINGGAPATVTGPLPFGDGIHTIALSATDNAGFSAQGTQIIQVDTITPSLNIAISGTSGLNGWYVSNVTVTPTAGDGGSGLYALEVNKDGTGYVPYSAPVVFTDGLHTWQFRATDYAGNVTETAQQAIKVDATTPSLSTSTSGTSGSNGWYVSNVTVTPTVSDGGSGLAAFVVSTDGAAYSAYLNPIFFTEGFHTVRFRATDFAGNVTETAQQTINVDTTTPAISLSIIGTLGTNGWYRSNVTVKANVSDATSAVGLVEASADGGAWGALSQLSFADGPHTYQFKVTDNAGNNTTVPLQNVKIDTIAPAIDMTAELSLGETVYYDLQDNGSGLSMYRAVIEDEDERYKKIVWLDYLNGSKLRDQIRWDGKFADGVQAGWGQYFITLKIGDAAGNETMRSAVVTVNPFSFLEEIPAFTPPPTTALPASEPQADSAPAATFGGENNNTSGDETVTTNEGGQSNPASDGTTTTSSTAGNIPNPFANGSVLSQVGALDPSNSSTSSTSTTSTTSTTSFPWGLLAAASATVLAGGMAFQNNSSQTDERRREEPVVVSVNRGLNTVRPVELQSAGGKDDEDDGPDEPSDILGDVIGGIGDLYEGIKDLKDDIPVVTTAARRIITAYGQVPPSLSQLDAFNQTLVPYMSYDPSLPKPPSGIASDVLISPYQNAFGQSPSSQQLSYYDAWRAYQNGNISANEFRNLGENLVLQDVNRSTPASQIDLLDLRSGAYNITEAGAGGLGGLASLGGLIANLSGHQTAAQNLTITGNTLGGWADLSQGLRGLTQIVTGPTVAEGTQAFASTFGQAARIFGLAGGAFQFLNSADRIATEPELQVTGNERTGVTLQMLGGGLLMVGSAALLLGVSAPLLVVAVPVGLVVGAVGLAVEHWDDISATLKESAQVWKSNIQQGGVIVDKLTTIARNQTAKNVETVGNKTAEKITKAGENLANKVTKAAENTAKVVTKVTQAAATTVTKVTEKAASVVNNASNALANLVKPFSPGASAAVQKAGQAVSSTIAKVGQAAANKISSVGQNAANTINKAGQAASNAIKSTTQKAASVVKSITSSFSNWFKKP